MAPSQNADDGNCPDCHKSLAANRGHLENIFYNQMSPVLYPCTHCLWYRKYSHPFNFPVIVMVKPHVKHFVASGQLKPRILDIFTKYYSCVFCVAVVVSKRTKTRRYKSTDGSMVREGAQRDIIT